MGILEGVAQTPDRNVTHGQLVRMHLCDDEASWSAAGFEPDLAIGSTLILADQSATLRAAIQGVDTLDGLALDQYPGGTAPPAGTSPGPRDRHPNGVESIDHVVVLTPNPDRTTAAFEAQGFEARRVRRFETADGTRRQTFHWLGDTVCEVVGSDDGSGDGPATWWGLALTVADIDATARSLGEFASAVKPAVQPGRQVCTLRHPDITTPVLFISPKAATAGATT